MSKVPKFCFENYPPAKAANVANPRQDDPIFLAGVDTLAKGRFEKPISQSSGGAPQTTSPDHVRCPDCKHARVKK
jgi:hypothetical protein